MFVYVSGCGCVHVSVVPAEALGSSGARVTGGCEQPNVGAGK